MKIGQSAESFWTKVSLPMSFDSKQFLSQLPHLPGVYRMLNSAGEVIYVGKARNLKKRVSAYFQKTIDAPRTRAMVAQIDGVEVTATRSEAEALLLENNLIKELSPRYNVLFRDDKSYPYVMIQRHDFPRLAFHRGALDKTQRYFGPFPNAGAVRESMQLMQKIFRIRSCEDSIFNNRTRPCLLHQIQRCTAPCVGHVAAEAYASDIEAAILFLEGKDEEVMDALSAKMQAAAEAENFELAALCRDQIVALRRVREKQFISRDQRHDVDVIACVIEAGVACVNLVMIRGGRHLGDKCYFPKNAEEAEAASVLEAFLSQHYLSRPVPSQILVNETVETSALLAELLGQESMRKVQISSRVLGERRIWLEMAEKNAHLALTQRLSVKTSQQARLSALRNALGLPGLARIECFDISHTMGEATVASCVVFDRGAMQNAEYRRFNISGITAGDDYAAMRNVLERRYKRLVSEAGILPDLILIDGGKGQLGIAGEVLAELGLGHLCVIGVAKGEQRKPGLETLFFTDGRPPLSLRPTDSASHLVQLIRDEAHRFAIAGHRAKRAKTRMRSTLEDIEGIGSKRRQALLTHFGGLRGVSAASVDEIAQIAGISRALAERIYQVLH